MWHILSYNKRFWDPSDHFSVNIFSATTENQCKSTVLNQIIMSLIKASCSRKITFNAKKVKHHSVDTAGPECRGTIGPPHSCNSANAVFLQGAVRHMSCHWLELKLCQFWTVCCLLTTPTLENCGSAQQATVSVTNHSGGGVGAFTWRRRWG